MKTSILELKLSSSLQEYRVTYEDDRPIIHISQARWYCLGSGNPVTYPNVMVYCYTCGGYISEAVDLGDEFHRCPFCGQVYDHAPANYYRPPAPPTHKTVSHTLPSGRVVRRRVPLDQSDSQLDLFGGGR
ncbi:hypothetical protein F6V25_05140 [Oryzomonas japonica]|uniref:Uncharacterized protein n=1 Tax=Oryzomonas japonica TaxID=2603858 RepID=A0A7J4ZTN2_9BACT|nr:hypothetical protein [Oryzomonas japonica]KAB0666801.1 hypothetical protein F6V25_05140 [Oryzomonas japonica]